MIEMQFDFNVLLDYEKQDKLRHGKHPIYDLHIWNYSEKVQFSRAWDTITETCRGVITDGTGRILARSFPKFFNLEEIPAEKVSDWMNYPYSVCEKVDGSLGILFFYQKEKTWIFTSRGSFTSEQAQEAMKILKENHPNFHDVLDYNVSYIFEIIYPDNHIVVNYGDNRELVLLGMYNNITGEEIDLSRDIRNRYEEYGFKTVKEIISRDLWTLKADDIPNQEGYVVKFETGTVKQRMKIKFENYILLHRAVSNISVKRLFDLCEEGKKFEEIVQNLPDEFHTWCSQVYNAIESKYEEVLKLCKTYYEARFDSDRKSFALSIQNHPHKTVLFLFYSNAPEIKVRSYIFSKVLNVEEFEIAFAEAKKNSIILKNDDGATLTTSSKIGSGISSKKSIQKPYVIILIGVSGSGKSTWVKNHLKEHKDFIVISRDHLRHQLFRLDSEEELANYYSSENFGKSESLVSEMQESMILCALQQNKSLIIDNTHLKLRYIKEMVKLVGDKAHVMLKTFDEILDVEELLARIRRRTYNNKMAQEIIERQLQDYNQLFQNFKSPHELLSHVQETVEITGITQNPSLPPCYIFDIDGTLALNVSGRSYYDMTRVQEDVPNPQVVQMLLNLKANYKIIICTGRTEDGAALTESWLKFYKIPFDEIHYRPINNTEKDCFVKEKMWRDISTRYHINAMYDDRNQVVDHARKLGFTVFQVDTNFN